MTKRDTVVAVAERAISLRLDEEAQRALELLMLGGKSQSAAVREALIEASKLRLYEVAAADAARLGSDPDDLREVAAIRASFDAVDESG